MSLQIESNISQIKISEKEFFEVSVKCTNNFLVIHENNSFSP